MTVSESKTVTAHEIFNNNAVLMAMLDDIVQVIADKSNEEWATDNSIEHKVFRKLVREIGNRLN